jgi:MarR family 2-MHQ and catechol resistance regulon transcriptional repressor
MNRYRGPQQEEIALDAFVKLLRASEAVSSGVGGALEEAGVTHSQFAVLDALFTLGPLCLGELARKILKTSGNLTMVVRNLEKRRLVRRLPQPRDRRYVQVEITGKGAQLYRACFPRHRRRIALAMSALSSEDQETLAALCRKLGKFVPTIEVWPD